MTDAPFRTVIEPFRIHSVEPLRMTTADYRRAKVREAAYNLFQLHADDVLIDLLTDSGTGAMSRDQWAAIQHGDESYAGSPSYFIFRDAVRDLFPYEHVIPTHQGRAAERILFQALAGPGTVIPSNTHFDTTRANIEYTGAEAVDLVIDEGRDPSAIHPFKGNIDLDRLEDFLTQRGDDVPCVMMTITNNSGGGQPVSLANLRAAADIAHAHGKPLFLDAARFAENAWFIHEREEGQSGRDVRDIIRDLADCADGMTMSAKKDPMGNIGGWLALRDDDLAAKCRNLLILTEGFPTYGGLAGRFTAAQQALYEVVLEAQLAAIREVKPGQHWNQPHDVTVRVITEGLRDLGLLDGEPEELIELAAYRTFYMHRAGHWLGLDVHDVGDYKIGGEWRVLEPGMVLTVEPGVYIAPDNRAVAKKWRGIGIRIEDDVVVTRSGSKVLTADAPKSVQDIRQLMAGAA